MHFENYTVAREMYRGSPRLLRGFEAPARVDGLRTRANSLSISQGCDRLKTGHGGVEVAHPTSGAHQRAAF